MSLQIKCLDEIFVTVFTIKFMNQFHKYFYKEFQIAYSSKNFATLMTIESFDFHEQL